MENAENEVVAAATADGGSSFRGGGGGGGEGRSFRSGGGGERSFSRGSRSGESFRSFDRGPSTSQSFRSSESIRDGFRASGRGSFDAGQLRNQPSNLGTQRTFSRDTSRDNGQFRDQQTFRSRGDSGLRTARSQSETGQNRYQTNRPTDNQVRDFLQMPQDRGDRQSRQPGDRNFDSDFRRTSNCKTITSSSSDAT